MNKTASKTELLVSVANLASHLGEELKKIDLGLRAHADWTKPSPLGKRMEAGIQLNMAASHAREAQHAIMKALTILNEGGN